MRSSEDEARASRDRPAIRRREREAPPAPPFRPSGTYWTAVLLAWLLPGAGHWVLGRRVRGAVLGALLLGTFWWGEVLAGGYAVIREEHPIWFCCQVLNGASGLLADRLELVDPEPPPVVPGGKGPDRDIPPGLPLGILLTAVSGLLNVLLILHVMDPRTWEETASGGRPPRGSPGRGGGPGGGGAAR